MAEKEKKQGFIDKIYKGLNFVSQVISTSILSPVTEGAEVIMQKIEDRIELMEKRIIRKLSSLLITAFGAIFLIFALLFFFIDYLKWSTYLSFFIIGVIIFIIGLILKIRTLSIEKEKR